MLFCSFPEALLFSFNSSQKGFNPNFAEENLVKISKTIKIKIKINEKFKN